MSRSPNASGCSSGAPPRRYAAEGPETRTSGGMSGGIGREAPATPAASAARVHPHKSPDDPHDPLIVVSYAS